MNTWDPRAQARAAHWPLPKLAANELIASWIVFFPFALRQCTHRESRTLRRATQSIGSTYQSVLGRSVDNLRFLALLGEEGGTLSVRAPAPGEPARQATQAARRPHPLIGKRSRGGRWGTARSASKRAAQDGRAGGRAHTWRCCTSRMKCRTRRPACSPSLAPPSPSPSRRA